jgi:hypothetical protein
MILRHAYALVVHDCQEPLGFGMTIFRSRNHPPGAIAMAPRCSLPHDERAGQLEACFIMAIFRSQPEPSDRLFMILRHPATKPKQNAKRVLRRGITSLCRLLV